MHDFFHFFVLKEKSVKSNCKVNRSRWQLHSFIRFALIFDFTLSCKKAYAVYVCVLSGPLCVYENLSIFNVSVTIISCDHG